MSGRPKAFSPWAIGSYPVLGKPWDSTAKRVTNANACFTPGVAASAQEVNDAVAVPIDYANLLLSLSGQQSAMNWPTSTLNITAGVFAFQGMAADNKYGRWFVYGSKNGIASANVCYGSDDGGVTWATQGGQNPTGTPSCAIQCVLFNPTSGKLAVCTLNPGGTPATDVSTLTDEEARFSNSISTAYLPAGIVFNGLYIFGGRNSTTTPTIQHSPLGTNSFSVTTIAGLFGAPSTWGTATNYVMAASPTQMIMVAIGVANYGEYVYTSNGTTYTLGTHGFQSGWSNTGCCYASDRYIIAQSNGTDSRFIYSLDGVNWFVAATLTGVLVGGIASVGALVFMTTFAHSKIRGAWSVDGCFTVQYGGRFTISPDVAGVPDKYVTSNGSQFAVMTTTGSKMSLSEFMGSPGG